MGQRMLRAQLKPTTTDITASAARWRVSSGSAAVLGLASLRLDAPPTTVYLMLGERCQRNCAFCAQARESTSHQDALSRVIWPAYPRDDVAEATARAYRRGEMRRACFQVTVGGSQLAETLEAVTRLAGTCDIPICVSVAPRDIADVTALLSAGAERVTIALDAATPEIYRRVKGGSWQRTLELLLSAAQAHPGRISTHLIVGLGESERQMIERLADLHTRGITIGLFAFTPVVGTRMADCPPPSLGHYRRIQAARWLIVGGHVRAEDMRFDDAGRLVSLGLPRHVLQCLLASGDAFRTSGCPDCNRPYYNERPSGPMYNYAQPLTSLQKRSELDDLLSDLAAV